MNEQLKLKVEETILATLFQGHTRPSGTHQLRTVVRIKKTLHNSGSIAEVCNKIVSLRIELTTIFSVPDHQLMHCVCTLIKLINIREELL
jgi:hypothetical protein